MDYALALKEPQRDCPVLDPSSTEDPQVLCAAIFRARVAGDAQAGRLEISFWGTNWARRPVLLPVLGPAGVFSVHAVRGAAPPRKAPSLLLAKQEDCWSARVEPGDFAFTLELSFDPRPSVELDLPGPIAQLEYDLSSGSLRVDEDDEAWHGGAIRIETGKEQGPAPREEPLTIRVVRVFHWGSVPTFEYRYGLSGVREQREVVLPLVSGERIETIEPNRPFEQDAQALKLTVAPGQGGIISLKGHLPQTVERLAKPEGLPFEHWLFVTDQRHPVRLSTDGREIDPAAVEGVEIPVGSRAYFLTDRQALAIEEIQVEVDEGRGGSGEMSYLFVQGERGHWVGNLTLTAKLPKHDRLSVQTPAALHYADRGGTAMRMFKDDEGVLSVQLDERLARGVPIRLQWQEEKGINPFLSYLRFELPSQYLHLDRQAASAHFKPGYVPVAAFGGDSIEGHLVNRFQVFALLMGLLAFVLCHAARFPLWLSVVMALLFLSLDQVDSFPRIPLFLMLATTAAVVRLPASAMESLRSIRWLHVLVTLAWAIFLAIAVFPLVSFVQGRVHSALHPWSHDSQQVYVDSYSSGYLQLDRGIGGKYDYMDLEDDGIDLVEVIGGEIDGRPGKAAKAGKKKDKLERKKWRQQQQQQQQVVPATAEVRRGDYAGLPGISYLKRSKSLKAQAPAEKSMRPVALDQPHLPGNLLEFSARSLLPGQAMKLGVLVAGPWTRRLWIFLEALLLVALVSMVLRRAAALWRSPKEAKP